MRCGGCGLDRDPQIWFARKGTEINEKCRECEFKTDRMAAMAVVFLGAMAVAAAPPTPARSRKKFDVSWLKRSANDVRQVIKEAASLVSPEYAAAQLPKTDALAIGEQTWHLRKPACCAGCKKDNPLMMIQEDGLWSSLCKVCILIKGRHVDNSAKREAEAAEERKRIEAITFRPIERTRVEKYTIQCTQCKKRHDPAKVRMVAAICEQCVAPDERDLFEGFYDLWDGPNSGRPAPARMM